MMPYRSWVRDYGVCKANGVAFTHARQILMQWIVRAGMFVTQTQFGFDNMWDDYLHDNLPMCWYGHDETAYDDATMTAAHTLLIQFVREDMDEDPTIDIIPL
jgi:hypothetical protein